MKRWQEIKIAERDLGDLLDELSPVVAVGASRMHAPSAKCRHVGWVADWVLAGVLAELEWEFDSAPLEVQYVPQRRPYVLYCGMGYCVHF